MKHLFTIASFTFFTTTAVFAQEFDVLVRGGKIVDGTGNAWFYGDVGIKNGRIARIGQLSTTTAKTILDAKGLIVCPGFIDVHTHIEEDEFKLPTADNFIYDGVTTVVTGNCGLSNVDLGLYFRQLDSVKTSVNVASMIGHNDVRKAVMGTVNRSSTSEEQQRMEAIVEKAMKDGAVGLATGLIYVPGTYSKTEEIVGLAKVAARYGGVYASHIRYEGDEVLTAIEEAVAIGRQATIPVQISHFKVSGQNNWGRSKETIAAVENARREGIDVTIDQYPYTASSTGLNTLLPSWSLAGGLDSIKARVNDPATRQRMIKDMVATLKRRKQNHFTYAVVAYYDADTTLNGKNIEEINLLKGRKHKATAEAETIVEMALKGGASMVFHGMGDWDVENIMRYPQNMFASDASIRVYNFGVPHPRGYGTNARVLGYYVRQKKIIPLEEAIRRMTSLPAQKFKLTGRGILQPNMVADVLVFDEATIIDASTYDRPHQYSRGMKYVIVNGELVVDNEKHTGRRSGKVLRKGE
ncbi:N-acyl-D-amino-acid deacylase family protein [Runella sp.]|uniref:N-acyl-D-amino-acid deacylase family protein n=1 Tax=Runella sp. TaxID=1960881 RepID=UPI003D0B4B16